MPGRCCSLGRKLDRRNADRLVVDRAVEEQDREAQEDASGRRAGRPSWIALREPGSTRSTAADTPMPASSSLTISATRAKSNSGAPQPNSSAGIAPGSESIVGQQLPGKPGADEPRAPAGGRHGPRSDHPDRLERPEDARQPACEMVGQQVLEELAGDHRQEIVRVGPGRRLVRSSTAR